MREYKQGQRTIIGRILPSELDENNNVTDVGIETDDSEEYLVFMDAVGEEMIPHIDRQVEASGTVKEMYGDLIITVERYRLLDEKNQAA